MLVVGSRRPTIVIATIVKSTTRPSTPFLSPLLPPGLPIRGLFLPPLVPVGSSGGLEPPPFDARPVDNVTLIEIRLESPDVGFEPVQIGDGARTF